MITLTTYDIITNDVNYCCLVTIRSVIGAWLVHSVHRLSPLHNNILFNHGIQVDDLKSKLASQEVELAQKNEAANKLIQVVGAETEKVCQINYHHLSSHIRRRALRVLFLVNKFLITCVLGIKRKGHC